MKPSSEPPGLSLELIVAKIQQMMDPSSTVTHNEWLVDRVGNSRQYDVVIRGTFGGRDVLGVVECKDHKRKKGPNTIEAFSKKTENLGANLRLIVSRKGFTPQALALAKHEHIGCLSLLPNDPEQVGFSIGDMWYGVIDLWAKMRLQVEFASGQMPAGFVTFDTNSVKWQGKPVVNWVRRELYTKHNDEQPTPPGMSFMLKVTFEEAKAFEIEGYNHLLSAISCQAEKTIQKKRKWVYWSGDALYDWHTGKFTIPAKGTVVGSAVETDLKEWEDYTGPLPDLTEKPSNGFLSVLIQHKQAWDETLDPQTPDLEKL